MRRLTPKEIVEAFTITGLIPVRGPYSSRSGCALRALSQVEQPSGDIASWIHSNLDGDYAAGFWDAWQADVPSITTEASYPDNYIVGYWDGIIVRKAVTSAFSSSALDRIDPDVNTDSR